MDTSIDVWEMQVFYEEKSEIYDVMYWCKIVAEYLGNKITDKYGEKYLIVEIFSLSPTPSMAASSTYEESRENHQLSAHFIMDFSHHW